MNNKILTKQEMNTLKKYETHFHNARHGFIRGVYQIDINTMEPIYARLGYRLGSPNCGQCVLTMCNDLGKIYFKQKDER